MKACALHQPTNTGSTGTQFEVRGTIPNDYGVRRRLVQWNPMTASYVEYFSKSQGLHMLPHRSYQNPGPKYHFYAPFYDIKRP